MATRERIYSLSYQKPLGKDVRSEACGGVGAVWRMNVTLDDEMSGRIHTAACNGRDGTIVDAVQAVARFLKALAEHRVQDARTLLASHSDLLKLSAAEFEETLKLDLTRYQSLAGAQCLEMYEPPVGGRGVVVAGPACYLKYKGRLVDTVSFQLHLEGAGGVWKVASYEVVPY